MSLPLDLLLVILYSAFLIFIFFFYKKREQKSIDKDIVNFAMMFAGATESQLQDSLWTAIQQYKENPTDDALIAAMSAAVALYDKSTEVK